MNPSLSVIASAIKPVGIAWVNALDMTVIPLVVSLLVTGIASATQADSMGQLGAKAIPLFLVLLSAATAFAALIVPPLVSLLSIDTVTSAG
jgi:Na+/H+-dicarboxylate symporter